MLKSLLKKYYKKFSHNKRIVKFAKAMSAENLWHFHGESVAKAIALGVACGWIPLPFHTVIAIFLAILIDCNIPLVAISIWVANPLTMPLMYYYAYKLGAYILGVQAPDLHFNLTVQDALSELHLIWQPFLLGCLICGILSGLITYLIMRLIWPNINHKFK